MLVHHRKRVFEQFKRADPIKANLAHLVHALVLVAVEFIITRVGLAQRKTLAENQISERGREGRLEVSDLYVVQIARTGAILFENVSEQVFNIRSVLAISVAFAADVDDEFEVAFINEVFEGVFILFALAKLLQDSISIKRLFQVSLVLLAHEANKRPHHLGLLLFEYFGHFFEPGLVLSMRRCTHSRGLILLVLVVIRVAVVVVPVDERGAGGGLGRVAEAGVVFEVELHAEEVGE